MMIEGWGVAVDRLISDFSQGTVEWLVEEGERLGDWVIVEGQGSLDHPAYSSVTLALIHGATPQAMVMVHKPGLAEHDFDHLPEASFPIASLPGFIELHERVAGARRAIEGRRGRAQHVALPRRRRGSPDHRRRSRPRPGCRPTTRSASGADRLWPAVHDAVEALPWVEGRVTLRLSHETLHLSLRDPFHIAREDHDSGDSVTTVVVEVRDDRFDGHRRGGGGLPGPLLRRDARHDGRRLPVAARRPWATSTPSGGRVGSGRPRPMEAAIRGHGAARCAIDIALHDLVGKVTGRPAHELRGLSADIPPTDFTIGIDEPAVVAERAARAADFPALKIKCGGPKDLATLRGRARRLRRADPRRREHRLGPRGGRRPAARPRAPRRRAHRAAVPGRPARPAPLAPGAVVAADRRRRELRPDRRTSTDSSGSSPASTSSSPSAAASARPSGCCERARELGFKTFLGCMEETSVGIAGSAVVASLADWVDLDGCLLLADDPFEGLDLDDRPPLAADRPARPRADSARLTRRARPVPRSDRTGVHRTSVLVDNLVDEVVDKPPSGGRRPVLRWSPTGSPRAPQGGAAGGIYCLCPRSGCPIDRWAPASYCLAQVD